MPLDVQQPVPVGTAFFLPVGVRHRRCEQQTLGVGVLRIGGDDVGRALLNNLAAVHHGHAVADVADHVQVVRDEEIGDAGVPLDLQEQERVMIERALERFGGNRRQAAEALKISTVTLWRRMKQFGISA